MLASQGAFTIRPRAVCTPRLGNRHIVRAVCSSNGGNGAVAKAKVQFELPLQTAFGENVAVVGSFTNWDASEPLRLEWSEGNIWTGEAELPAGETLEYKYLVTNAATGAVTWQPGSNMVLQLSARAVRVLDDWLGQQHEVQPLAAEDAAAAPAAEAADEQIAPPSVPAAVVGAAAVAAAAASVGSTAVAEAEHGTRPAATSPYKEPSGPLALGNSSMPGLASGPSVSGTQAVPKPAAIAKPAPKRPAVAVRKPSSADKPWKPAQPAPAAAPAASPAGAASTPSDPAQTPLAVAAASIKAEARRAKDKAPSAAMPVVVAVVCFAVVAAAVTAGAPLVVAGLSVLRQGAASALRFLTSLGRS